VFAIVRYLGWSVVCLLFCLSRYTKVKEKSIFWVSKSLVHTQRAAHALVA
jgi:uncharacterized membrane protein required for colicin V production